MNQIYRLYQTDQISRRVTAFKFTLKGVKLVTLQETWRPDMWCPQWVWAEGLDEGLELILWASEGTAVRAEILSSWTLQFWWHRVPFYLSINKGWDFTYSASCSRWSLKKHIFLNVQPFGLKPYVQLLSKTHHCITKHSITQTLNWSSEMMFHLQMFAVKIWSNVALNQCLSNGCEWALFL